MLSAMQGAIESRAESGEDDGSDKQQ
jgi:hypothetical protein